MSGMSDTCEDDKRDLRNEPLTELIHDIVIEISELSLRAETVR